MTAGYGDKKVSSKLQVVETPVRPEVMREVLASEAEEAELVEDCRFDGGIESERLELEKEEDVVKKVNDPKLPTAGEVEKHRVMGHLPFRDWCPVCIKARGRETDHRRATGKERNMPEYSIDYCFPGDELGYKWTVLAGRERINKSWLATTVPMKGGSGRFAVDKVLEFIKENGDASRDIILKSDQEPSMKYLVKDLLEQRSEGRTVVEESPKKVPAAMAWWREECWR